MLFRRILSVLVGVFAVAAGLYAGLYLMFVCGIIQVVNAVQADPVDGGQVAWGIVRIVFGDFVGVVVFWLLMIAAIALWGSDKPTRRVNRRF